MIYKIKNCLLEIINELHEFDELIYGRFSQFAEVKETQTDNYLKFDNWGIDIKINGKRKEIKGKVIKTDIYVIINNILSFIINDKENIYIHSVVVSNKEQGILIVGDFGQGKTTLADEFVRYGYELNSTDQTWIKHEDSGLEQVVGSRFYIDKGNIKYIEKRNTEKKVKINKIIRIVGICDNGVTNITEQKDNIYIVKQISDYCNWTNIAPIFTNNDAEIFNIKKYTKDFWLEIKDIHFLNVRGDKKEIVKLTK